MAYGDQQGFQYHAPVAPEVPAPDNTAAKIIAAGTDTILTGLTRMAIARREQEVEQKKMMLNAQLTSRELDIQEQNNIREANLKGILYNSYQTNANANELRAQTTLERLMATNKIAAESAAQTEKLKKDVDEAAHRYGMYDEEAWAKNPAKQALGLRRLKDEFPMVGVLPDTGIPQKFARWQALADQQKIPIRYGAYQSKDKEGNPVWKGGETKPVAIWQIADGIMNEHTRKVYLDSLRATGLVKDDESGHVIFDPSLKALETLIHEGDFSRSKNRMPNFVPKSTREQRAKRGDVIYDPNEEIDESMPPPADEPDAVDTTTPSGELPAGASGVTGESDTAQAPPPIEPTGTDVTLNRARNAIARGAPIGQVAARLREKGIDPQLLFA